MLLILLFKYNAKQNHSSVQSKVFTVFNIGLNIIYSVALSVSNKILHIRLNIK